MNAIHQIAQCLLIENISYTILNTSYIIPNTKYTKKMRLVCRVLCVHGCVAMCNVYCTTYNVQTAISYDNIS